MRAKEGSSRGASAISSAIAVLFTQVIHHRVDRYRRHEPAFGKKIDCSLQRMASIVKTPFLMRVKSASAD